MFQMVLVALGLFLGTANAAELPEPPEAEPARATAGPFGGGRGPAETVADEVEKKKSEKELAREARLKAIEDATKAQAARVVVLQWKGTDTTYKNENLQRNVRSRIARPEARFYPDIDLYQSGRTEPDQSLRPVDQRAVVPDDAIARLTDAADEVATIPWNALSEADWGIRAQELLRLSREIWFVDRPELREPLFLLYAQIGRAAENASQGTPPYYEGVRGRTVNYFWYLAASLAHQDPSLMSKITDNDLNTSITFLKDQIDSGAFEPQMLSFALEDRVFDAKGFADEYILVVDGIEQTITNTDGILGVPPGRTDVYLKRDDGHSLSDRVEIGKMDDKVYFVRNNARTLMGLDFIQQLMENPNECTPSLDGKILTYLSIYQRLHPTSDIYIVVPERGSTAPGRLFLWRWNPILGQLTLVRDNTGGFPIRFAALASTGVAFGTVDYTKPDPTELEASVGEEAGAPPNVPQRIDQFAGGLAPIIDGVPIDWQLRGHYNRLMMSVGLQYKIGFGGPEEPSFVDAYQIDKGEDVAVQPAQVPCPDGEGGDDFAELNADQQAECRGTGTQSDSGNNYTTQVLALRERQIQRLVYMTIGVVLKRDASSGFGPRGYLRFGWTNAPHAVDMTAHVGYTARIGRSDAENKKDEDRGGRVRAILDVDFFGGVLAPYRSSIYMAPYDGTNKFLFVGKPFATFGFTVGAGMTF